MSMNRMSFHVPVPFEDMKAGVVCHILLDQPNGQRIVRVVRVLSQIFTLTVSQRLKRLV